GQPTSIASLHRASILTNGLRSTRTQNSKITSVGFAIRWTSTVQNSLQKDNLVLTLSSGGPLSWKLPSSIWRIQRKQLTTRLYESTNGVAVSRQNDRDGAEEASLCKRLFSAPSNKPPR